MADAISTLHALPAVLRTALEATAGTMFGGGQCQGCLSATPAYTCPDCAPYWAELMGGDPVLAAWMAVDESEVSEETSRRFQQRYEQWMPGQLDRLDTLMEDVAALRAEATDPLQRGRAAFAHAQVRHRRRELASHLLGPGRRAAPEDPVDADLAERLLAAVITDLPAADPLWTVWGRAGETPFAPALGLIDLTGALPDPAPRSALLAYLRRVAEEQPDQGTRDATHVVVAVHALSAPGGTTDGERDRVLRLIRATYGDDPRLSAEALTLLDPDADNPESPPPDWEPEPALPAGAEAPDFDLPSATGGEPVRITRYAGAPVFLFFTGSWCGPCQIELPHVRRLHARWAERGVRFVSVNLEPDLADLPGYLADNGVTWDVAVGDEGTVGPVMQQYGAVGVPTFFLLDQQGIVLVSDFRPSEESDRVEAALEQAVLERQ